MATSANLQVPPPSNWQDFQDLCWALWRNIWNDPDTQLNGRQGQPQAGVDIYGRPNRGDNWAGIQCKGKDNLADKHLTEAEVLKIVADVKTFKPQLSELIIATTGSKDAKMQELAREITDQHKGIGLFSVTIMAWEDIRRLLDDYQDLIERYCQVQTSTKAVRDSLRELEEKILDHQTEQTRGIKTELKAELKEVSATLSTATLGSILETEYHAELDKVRDLLIKHEPKQALELLEDLRGRIWHKSDPIIKFRITTNKAAAKVQMKDEREAGLLYLEALQYNPEDEKALTNAALGHLLLNEHDKALLYAEKVLKRNIANTRAYSIIIQASEDGEKEKKINEIPKLLKESPDIAYTIAHVLRKKGRLVEAEEWAECAAKNDKEDLPDLKANLAEIQLEQLTSDPGVTLFRQLDERKQKQLNTAIELLTSAWDSISKSSLRFYRVDWIANRSIAKRLAGDFRGAAADLEIALEIDHGNMKLLFQRAAIAYESGDPQKAEELLGNTIKSGQVPESTLLLSEVLEAQGRLNEAIGLLEKFILKISDEELINGAQKILLELYLKSGQTQKAKNLSDSMRKGNPTSAVNLVFASRVLKVIGDTEGALALLTEAKGYLGATSDTRERIFLADALYFSELYADAAEIYERVVDKNSDSPWTRRLLNSYYRAGELKKALGMCTTLREHNGTSTYVAELETLIYERIGDLNSALNVCQEYLTTSPDDLTMRVRLAVLNYRAGHLDQLDSYLSTTINTENLSLSTIIQLVHLYIEREFVAEALRTMYEARRKFFDEPEAHLQYVGLFWHRQKAYEHLLNIDSVSKDMAIEIEDEYGGREWYILEDRSKPLLEQHEVNFNHPLAKSALGKKVGEGFQLSETPISVQRYKIVAIKNKYLYALHESLNSFGKLFPAAQGLWKIKTEVSKEGEPRGLGTILDLVSKQHERHQAIEQFYKNKQLTIGAFSALIGWNVLEAFSGLMSRPDLGIQCCNGNVAERNAALSLLEQAPKLIVDIISLSTLHGLNLGDAVLNTFGRFGIAQTTIDLLREIIATDKGIHSQGFMVIGKEGETFVRQEISPDTVKKNIENLEKILMWVEKNCDVLPCQKALDVQWTRKQELDDLLNISFVDTILISSEPGNILYSEDERLRSLATYEFAVKGVWTQIILMYLLKVGKITQEEYNKATVKLVHSNFYHTSVDHQVLIESAHQANWMPAEPFNKVAQVLSGWRSDEQSAVSVATNFLYELWKQPILATNREYLTLKLFDSIVIGRNATNTIGQLTFGIKHKFQLLPLAQQQLFRLVKIWKEIHYIP
jgi:tetratricopeptide (TPR) repeat protein